jgi:hypothetical protein
LVKALVAWSFSAAGLNAALGSKMAMALTPVWIYSHVVWGGIWGLLFLLPGGLITSGGPCTAFPRRSCSW